MSAAKTLPLPRRRRFLPRPADGENEPPPSGDGGRARALAARLVVGTAILFLASVALFWPGYVQYDSLAQYRQVLAGRYDDWHPPAMARLWSLFGAHGQAPMMLLQLAAYWFGFGAIMAALAVRRRRGAALAVLLIALWPALLGWQPVVLKDAQMLGAMLAATGIVGWWRLRDRLVPRAAVAAVAVLLGYAMLVRANAVFAVVPFALALIRGRGGLPSAGQAGRTVAAALGLVLLVIALSGPINHRLFAAARSGVERTQPLYDLAGIAVRTGDTITGLSPRAIAALRAKRCVRPYFWDPLGEPHRCEGDVAALHALPPVALYRRLAVAILYHPLAYAEHRAGHLNSTWRWWVPWRWPGAAPPSGNEPDPLRLPEPGPAAYRWQEVAGLLVLLPTGWPIVWIALALTALLPTLRGQDGRHRLAAALLVSALALEGSFAVLSIASDLRYHLWPMAATAIAWAIAPPRPLPRRGLALVLLVIAIGLAARALLPTPPQTYAGMLG